LTNELLKYEEINPKGEIKASVIWLHGLGSNGHDFFPIEQELELNPQLGLRFVFPHAPIQAITLYSGQEMPAWYDIFGLNRGSNEDEKGVLAMSKRIGDLIEAEHARGVPYEKILLAGFSQGGALAFAAGLQFPHKLGGLIALSTYLPIAKTLLANPSPANRNIPIMLVHGTQDHVVPLSFGRLSLEYLTQHHYPVEWYEYPIAHDVSPEETRDIAKWIEKVLNN
jgi:phospholipase/carboxylesterase